MKQEGYDLMGAAFEDYSVLGYGMAEEIYQQSFEIGAAGYPKPRHAPPRESSILIDTENWSSMQADTKNGESTFDGLKTLLIP